MMNTASTILFVDDEKHVTKYFKKALSHTFSIQTANSVSDAITLLDKQHSQIAVVITDQRMPKQLGIELLQHTQTHYPDIVRMLTTAFCDVDSAVSAINKAEVFRYIPKPWDIDALEETIHHALNRFTTLNTQSINASQDHLIEEIKDDCQHWLMYAIHAYGDEDVYKSGIEALTCRYDILITNRFDKESASILRKEMEQIISDNFLTDSILEDLRVQSTKGFGVSDSNKNKH